MKLIILYHPKSDHAHRVEDYARDLEHLKNKHPELMSLETLEGAEMAKLYGIVQYPAILAVQENGEVLKHWEGAELPLMDEVAAYSS